jgi:acyl-CoA synthetase (AMP-forming)/AMP-acid ligase II
MWVYPEIRTLADIPRYHARIRPSQPAVTFENRCLDFTGLDRNSSRVAHAIIASGLPAESRIGYFGRNCIELAEILFGAAKAGHAFMPLNWRLAPREAAAIIANSECRLLFVDDALGESFDAALAFLPDPPRIIRFAANGTPWLGGFADESDDKDPALPIPESRTALQMYTSGTTGLPKGVELAHAGFTFMRLIEHLEPEATWAPGDSFLMFMPNFHMSGVGWLIQCLYNGMTVIALPQFEPAAVIEAIARTRPSLMIIVPTALQILLDHERAAATDFTCFKLVVYAGSQMPLPLIEKALARMQCGFLNCYGATELLSTATWLRPSQHDLSDSERLKSVGTACRLVDIRLLDSEGREVADGEVGEIVVRMAPAFKGYWRNPEATAAVMRNGWYHTGDAAVRDAQGYYCLKDRIKDMIVSGGENIYSSEVEAALVKHPAVAEVAVIGVPDPRWGEAVKALVIPMAGERPSPDALIAFAREHIAGYKVPKSIEFVDDFPRTPSGKVQKAKLRSIYG